MTTTAPAQSAYTNISSTTGVSDDFIPDASENIFEKAADTTTENISAVKKILNTLSSSLRVTWSDLLFAAVVFVIGYFLIKLILKLVTHAAAKSRLEKTAQGFLKSLIKIFLYIILFIVILSILHVPMTSIITVLGTAVLAVALALKDSLSNVAGGFLILLSKPLKTGDLVKIEDSLGRVEKVDILFTTIVTFDNVTVHIPNKNILDGKIENYSEKNIRRVDIKVEVSYDDDIAKVKEVLLSLAKNNKDVLKDPSPCAEVEEYSASSVVLEFRPWTKTENYWNVLYYFNTEIKKAFDENGITIPYQQIDIHSK